MAADELTSEALGQLSVDERLALATRFREAQAAMFMLAAHDMRARRELVWEARKRSFRLYREVLRILSRVPVKDTGPRPQLRRHARAYGTRRVRRCARSPSRPGRPRCSGVAA